ncbi:MAG: ABC transporter ATP-binding protein [Bacillota bacterium]
MTIPLLSVRGLHTVFHTGDGLVPAVDGVSFHLDRGETLGIVGESGSGKSVTSLSVMGLVPRPHGKVTAGEILFEGEDLLKKSDFQIRKIRGKDISMIFQEPMTSLNPVYTCGDQIAESIRLHEGKSAKEAMEKAVEMLRQVGIPMPEQRVHQYPSQLSGGMRQRVMIAMALACSPKLLIADEPTTALDVTIQAQILELMKKLKDEIGTAIMLITHDLAVTAEMADRVVVMYAGKVVEEAPVSPLFRKPLHPYTEGLMMSIPHLEGKRRRLHVIDGTIPNPLELPPGCRFNPRCPYAEEICRQKEPPLMAVETGRRAACWLRGTARRAAS